MRWTLVIPTDRSMVVLVYLLTFHASLGTRVMSQSSSSNAEDTTNSSSTPWSTTPSVGGDVTTLTSKTAADVKPPNLTESTTSPSPETEAITDEFRSSRSEKIVTLQDQKTTDEKKLLDCVKEETVTSQTPHRLAFLDGVLVGYDKRAWPSYGTGSPTQVQVNMYVNSLGSVNAANMEYSMDIYLRQLWLDNRLDLTPYHINETLTLNGEDISSRIWKPDLFFRNVKQANFHLVTVPNILIKMAPDGRILYSMRLTLRLSCHMSFRNYPLDTQRCHVILGAYAQTTDQIVIKWQAVDPIVIDRPIEVPEFDLIHFEHGNFTRSIDTGSFSFLNASFTLQRQNGYHVVQTYLPTFLIVMISWVSFWLNVDASPARVTLGVTTLLTLTTVASGVRTQLPPVSYVKAIDVWIGACSVMVFGALLEFALVNFLSRSKFQPYDIWRGLSRRKKQARNGKDSGSSVNLQTLTSPEKNATIPSADTAEPGTMYSSSRPGSATSNQVSSASHPRSMKMARNVDRVSRVTFPFIFFVFNIIYWPYYLYVPDGHESR